jgi:chemotaxis protein methyltransferase CheR
MKDEQCVSFLQWALPQLSLRWPGFRKVRGQVCKRVDRRMRELGLDRADDYRAWLEAHADEWLRLDAMCRITISRFYRDRAVFDTLAAEVLPALAAAATARGGRSLRAWSAGCGGGEEPYTLALLWRLRLESRFAGLRLEIVATDADPGQLQRARAGRYAAGTLRELPEDWRDRAFTRVDASYCLRPAYRRGIRFIEQDIRAAQPEGPFDLVLCRNLVFTYFDESRQRELLGRIAAVTEGGGALVLGAHEHLPGAAGGFAAWFASRGIYRRLGTGHDQRSDDTAPQAAPGR